MNKILKILTGLAGINYQMERWVDLIAEVKASGIDEAAQAEIIGVAEKAIDAETKRNTAVSALLEKYGQSENINAESDDDDDGFY